MKLQPIFTDLSIIQPPPLSLKKTIICRTYRSVLYFPPNILIGNELLYASILHCSDYDGFLLSNVSTASRHVNYTGNMS